MPAMYAHLRFGQEVLTLLPNALQETIYHHYSAFEIGLQGPDIFFFYKPYQKNKIATYGNELHRQWATMYLQTQVSLLQNVTLDSDEYCYILGFICHFVLDSSVHYLVDQYMASTHLDHYTIESEYEKYLLTKDHIIPQQFDYPTHIPTQRNISEAIQHCYSHFTVQEVHQALKAMHFYKTLLMTKSRVKQTLLKAIFKIPAMHSFQGLLLDFKSTSLCDMCNQDLETHTQEAIVVAQSLILSFIDSVQNNQPLHERFNQHFE